MISIEAKSLNAMQIQSYLQGAVAPRPIAFASTVDQNGIPNLSPFSFFNVFSSKPPILIFSPARRVRDNSVKHTLINCQHTKEVVINIVNFAIVQQMSLSSTEYGDGVDEFIKSGLTPIASDMVKPFRVKESPVQFECIVNEILPLGSEGGAGNLIICEVIKFHIDEGVLDEKGLIDPIKIDLVSRMGANWYSRAKEGLFEVEKPIASLGIGVDAIPNFVKVSTVFDGNDLGKLGNIDALPSLEEINTFVNESVLVKGILSSTDEIKVHQKAKHYLDNNEPTAAWKILLAKRIE